LVAHEDFEAKKIVLFNVDLETGGDSCGPVQILVAAYDPHQKTNLEEFNSYVNPAKGTLWLQHTINVHGILPTQPRIKEASELEEVWHCLLQYFEKLLQGGKKGIILAWGGKACDVE
jgi:inhibitor of KinA sporulation pathway (predicted exonuclease)